MARACIDNTGGHGIALAERLKSKNRIDRLELVRDDLVCVEFTDAMTITLEDYLSVNPSGSPGLLEKRFRQEVQLPMVKTLRGGELVEFVPGKRITVKNSEKTETVCVRLTREEKKRLEEEASKLGVSVSDYIRAKVFG